MKYWKPSEWPFVGCEIPASGAKLVKLKSSHVADALVEFAKREGITHVIFGQSARTRWEILMKGSTLNRFLEEVRDAAIQVVPLGEPDS